jgi:hypothetical protein
METATLLKPPECSVLKGQSTVQLSISCHSCCPDILCTWPAYICKKLLMWDVISDLHVRSEEQPWGHWHAASLEQRSWHLFTIFTDWNHLGCMEVNMINSIPGDGNSAQFPTLHKLDFLVHLSFPGLSVSSWESYCSWGTFVLSE